MRAGVALALALWATPVQAGEAVCGAAYLPGERIARRGIAEAHVAVPDGAGLTVGPAVTVDRRGSIRRVDLPEGMRLVALTFDLCETAGEVAGYDGGVVDVLRREGVAATFFVGGHWAATHGARFSELAGSPRFEIGNHSWSHANLRTIGRERMMTEIKAPAASFRAAAPICGPVASAAIAPLFRFPFGACDEASMAAVNDAGYLAIQWDVSTGDPAPGQSAAAIVATTLAQVRPGSIVLAHANGRGWHTAEALPMLIHELRKRGYTFVTVQELLRAGTPVIAPTCYDGHPGDTRRYDHFLGAGLGTKGVPAKVTR